MLHQSSIKCLLLDLCTQMIKPTTIKAIGESNINPLFSYPNAYKPVLSIGSPRTGIPQRVPEPSNSLKKPTKINITA